MAGNTENTGGWLAAFSNENGNVAVSRVLFRTEGQAAGWAKEALRQAGASGIRHSGKTVTGETAGGVFGPQALTYTLIPLEQAGADQAGEEISQNLAVSLR